MKSIKIFIFLLLTTAKINAQEVKFDQKNSLDRIFQLAKSQNKYVFIDCYATWCGPCKQMDQFVYTNDTIGSILNEKFISVKIQEDQTKSDDSITRVRYQDAKHVMKDFEIRGFPTYLFFEPSGKLIYRSSGFVPAKYFINVINNSLKPEQLVFANKIEEFKSGKRDYQMMLPLITTTREVLGDKNLAREMFSEYKVGYLNTLNAYQLANKETLDLLGQYWDMINISDPLFSALYSSSNAFAKIDPNFRKRLVEFIIVNERLDKVLFKGDSVLNRQPNWTKLTKDLADEFPEIGVEKLIKNYQITLGGDGFYNRIKDWKSYVNYYNERIKDLGNIDANDVFSSVAFSINLASWNMFKNCNDKPLLKKAIEWIDVSLKLDPNLDQSWDTKASLLYKLGRVKEAISTQIKAIEVAKIEAVKSGDKDGGWAQAFTEKLEIMKRGGILPID